MNQTETNYSPVIGLDVGTSRIVTARQAGNGIEYDSQLNAFVTIPFSRMTASMLQKENVPHAVEGAEIVVHGSESERFADLLSKDVRRTMARGVLNPDEPDGERLIRQIMESLVGRAERGQKVCFAIPAPPLGAEEALTYHEATLRRILAGLGFEVQSINEGLAVVYAELESSNYTGIGVSCGGGLCNVCLSYLSIPIISFSTPKAGDFIDSSAAAAVGDPANRVRILKEQAFHFNGHFDSNLHKVLMVYYDDMIQALVTAMRNAFQSARNLPKLPRSLPLILSGGTSAPRGFRDRFDKALRASDFPIEISEIRMAADPLTATARGTLIAGMAEM